MSLIVGLGNPGGTYERTRHNLGFRVVDRLCSRWGDVGLREGGRHIAFARVSREGRDIVLAKPMTFMNRSGWAVAELVREFAVRTEDTLVIYDDHALPMGNIRVRPRGGSGGHNGVASIIEALGTEEFPRVRIGIGPLRGDAVDYVLSPFTREEEPLAEEAVEAAADAVETILAEGIDAAMNQYNRRVKEENGIQRE